MYKRQSQDGPARSAGGGTGWAVVTLPDGEVGRSGAIVDPVSYTHLTLPTIYSV